MRAWPPSRQSAKETGGRAGARGSCIAKAAVVSTEGEAWLGAPHSHTQHHSPGPTVDRASSPHTPTGPVTLLSEPLASQCTWQDSGLGGPQKRLSCADGC